MIVLKDSFPTIKSLSPNQNLDDTELSLVKSVWTKLYKFEWLSLA